MVKVRDIPALTRWQCQPQAEKIIQRYVNECVEKSPFLKDLAKECLEQASIRLFSIVDHISVGYSEKLDKELQAAGFVGELATPHYRSFYHPGAQLPRIIVKDDPSHFLGIGIVTDSITDFLLVHGLNAWIEGSPLSGYRRALLSKENGVNVYIVERRATPTMEPTQVQPKELVKLHEAYEKWATRPRLAETEEEEIDDLRTAITCAEEIVELVGQPMAASIVLEVERRYWQSRNLAGQLQKNRQDRIGLGWANHDHHTFRCSRKYFKMIVRIFEILGFHPRERFYAGREAGWGAQIMEHPQIRLVLFLDVDLAPEEVDIDFAHHALPALSKLGTVGLWCALHGESILQAGMHHLEAQFQFKNLEKDLKTIGISMMAPFSDFPFLKQAFTKGETWPVSVKRVKNLLMTGLITQEEAARFITSGAIGSHLENLQREEGFKGFNQRNVSDIIERTNPRQVICA